MSLIDDKFSKGSVNSRYNGYTDDDVTAVNTLSMGFRFKVRLGGVFTFGFQSVDGIEVRRNVDYHPEGGVNDHKILVTAPQESISELTFTRGLMLRSSEIGMDILKAGAARISNNIARRAFFFGLNYADPQELLESGPTIGDIEVYSSLNRSGEFRAKDLVGLYSFIALGVNEWSLSSLDAVGGGPLIETFKVAHTGITRLPVLPPSAQHYYSSMADDRFSKFSTERYTEYKIGDKSINLLVDEKSRMENDKEWGDTTSNNMKNRPTVQEFEDGRKINLLSDEKALIEEAKKVGKEVFDNIKNRPITDKKGRNLKVDEESLKAKAEETAAEMEAMRLENERVSAEVSAGLQKTRENMQKDFANYTAAVRDWNESRSEGVKKTLEVRNAARKKTEKYTKDCKKLTELITKAQKETLKSLKENMVELRATLEATMQTADRSAKGLAIKLSKLKEVRKLKSEEWKDKYEETEAAKLAAIEASELAREMATASRDAARELMAKKWEETMMQREVRIAKLQVEFKQKRESGAKLAESKKAHLQDKREEFAENIEKIDDAISEFESKRDENISKINADKREKYAEEFEKTEKAREEFEKRLDEERQEAIRAAKEMADEAEEAAAELENAADDIDAMLEAAE